MRNKRGAMKSSTQDQVAGKLRQIKGRLKRAVGVITDDPKLEGEGLGEMMGGKIREKLGQIKKVFGK